MNVARSVANKARFASVTRRRERLEHSLRLARKTGGMRQNRRNDYS